MVLAVLDGNSFCDWRMTVTTGTGAGTVEPEQLRGPGVGAGSPSLHLGPPNGLLGFLTAWWTRAACLVTWQLRTHTQVSLWAEWKPNQYLWFSLKNTKASLLSYSINWSPPQQPAQFQGLGHRSHLSMGRVSKNLWLYFKPATTAAAAAKSLQSCPTLCDPIDVSPPGSPVPGILQARTLEWVAVAFSNACLLQCMKVKSENEVAQWVAIEWYYLISYLSTGFLMFIAS